MELSFSVNSNEGSLGSHPAGQVTSANRETGARVAQHIGGLQPGVRMVIRAPGGNEVISRWWKRCVMEERRHQQLMSRDVRSVGPGCLK